MRFFCVNITLVLSFLFSAQLYGVTDREARDIVTEYYNALNMCASTPGSRTDGIVRLFTYQNSIYNDVYSAVNGDYSSQNKSSISEYLAFVGGYYNNYNGYLRFDVRINRTEYVDQTHMKVFVYKTITSSGTKRVNYSYNEEIMVVSQNGRCLISGIRYISSSQNSSSQNSSNQTYNTVASAKLENIQALPNQIYGGKTCLRLKMKLSVNGCKGRKIKVVAYFYDSNGNALTGKGGYATTSGTLCVSSDVTPSYDNSEWSEFVLNMPYSELNIRDGAGTVYLKYDFSVWDMESSPYKQLYTTSKYSISISSNTNTRSFQISGTSRSFTDDAQGMSYLTTAIGGWNDKCRLGAITTNGMGIICYGDNGYAYIGIKNEYANEVKKLNNEGVVFKSFALTSSGYFVVVYGRNGWYGLVPDGMKQRLNQYNDNREDIKSVSIAENGNYVIITDEHCYASGTFDTDFLNKARDLYGSIKYVCTTNMGILVICERGIHYSNIPNNLETVLKGLSKKPDRIVFTDSGTYLITYEDGTNYYRM